MAQLVEPEAVESPRRLSQIIGRVAGVISAAEFPSGERALLKRLASGGPPALSFYRFAFRHLPAGWEQATPSWVAIINGMAVMLPNPHRPDRPAGQALAEHGFSEARLDRLLASDDDTQRTLLVRASRFLAAKGDSCNWTDFARLLLAQNPEKKEAARLAIARSYYRHLKD
jgi:CRISPR system Cascade subunit CasB